MSTARLINKPDLSLASYAARVCTATEDQHPEDGSAEHGLILRCIEKGHESVIEHVVLTFELEGFSRGVLHELVRHRIASFSVQSTRWSLKKLLKDVDPEDTFWPFHYLVATGDPILNTANMDQLRTVKIALDSGLKPDLVKTSLPEAFITKAIMTINLRSFRNFLKLRLAKNAFYQIRQLAEAMFNALPYEIAIMVEDCD